MTILRAAAIALALGLAACATGVTVVQVEHDAANMPDLFRYVAGGRALAVAVHGNPTSAPDTAFAAAVRAAMQGRNGGPATRFVAADAAGDDRLADWRVVMVFDRDRPVALRDLCRAPAGDAAPGARVALRAAFCHREATLAWVEITTPAITGPDDPRLARAVGAAVYQLFPPYDPDRPNGGGDVFDQ